MWVYNDINFEFYMFYDYYFVVINNVGNVFSIVVWNCMLMGCFEGFFLLVVVVLFLFEIWLIWLMLIKLNGIIEEYRFIWVIEW